MKRKISLLLSFVLLFSSVVCAADNDGWTEAPSTGAAVNGAWAEWCSRWENTKNDWEKISLTPGADESQLNFAWYSNASSQTPEFRFYEDETLSPAGAVAVTQTDAVPGYMSNKVTVKGIEPGTTYYYSYTKDGEWTTPVEYKSAASTSDFSFVFFGDPQIGSSLENVAENSDSGELTELGQDRAVRNDSFNWNNTVEKAISLNPDTAFMLSAGDQIQTRDKKTAAATHSTYVKNEIEYSGYLSPELLKRVPVATSIGNHDALSSNYSYHFNNPNASEMGATYAGGDYYFSYGNALFIMLNTNNTNLAEHSAFIKSACDAHENASWKVVTLHQDIYGSGEHSNEPEIVELRYGLTPVFEENDIDVVLTGHDHTYSRSFIMNTSAKKEDKFITQDDFDAYIDGDKAIDSVYNDYLTAIEDSEYIAETDKEQVTNPDGILYVTANSASGSKYYDLVGHQQAYIAARWQEDVPTFSMVDVSDNRFTINTYRTDTMEKIDNEFTIVKNDIDKEGFDAEDLALTPGNTEKDINLAWYSNQASGDKSLVRFNSGDKVINAEGTVKQVKGTYKDSDAVSAGKMLTGKLSHKASVEGLEAGTEYKYQVSNDGVNWSKEYTYTTADEGDFSFAFVGDPQLKEGQSDQGNPDVTLEESWKNTVNSIEEKGADFIASAGDQIEGKKINGAYKTNEKEYSTFFAPEELRSIPYAAAVGNHDINYGFQYHFNLPNEQPYALIENFKNNQDEEVKISESAGNYFYSYNDALFVVLNDSAYPCDSPDNYEAGLPVAKQYIDVFDKTLAKAVESDPDYKWLFVQHHKSTRTAAQHTCDFDVQAYVEAGFEKLMDKYDVDFVFAGHDHVYTKSYVLKDGVITNENSDNITNPDGTVYFTGNTATGKEYYDIFSAKAKNNEKYPALVNGLMGSEAFKSGNLPLGIANAVQNKKPAYYMVNVTDNKVEIKAYTNDSDEVYDSLVVVKEDEKAESTTVETSTETTTLSVVTTKTETTKKRTSGSSSSRASSSSSYYTIKPETNNGTDAASKKADGTSEVVEDAASKLDDAAISKGVKVTIGSESVIIGDKTYSMDVAPYIQTSSSSTLVPLRFVALAICGGDVSNADSSNIVNWNANTKTATINANGKVIQFTDGNSIMIVDGKTITMDNGVKAEISNSRMFIPFRALGKALGVDVAWDADTKTAVYTVK